MSTSKTNLFFAKLAVLIGSTVGLSACGAFATTTEVPGVTYVNFDERFPAGMKDYLKNCHNPLVMKAGQDELALKGSCDSTSDLDTDEGEIIYGLVAARKEEFSKIDTVIDRWSDNIRLKRWPWKGCRIEMSAVTKFKKLSLTPKSTAWDTIGSESTPAFSMYFEGSDSEVVAQLHWTRNIDCPKGNWQESLVESTYGLVIPSSQVYDIHFDELKLKLSNKISGSGTDFDGKAAAELTYDGILVSSDEIYASLWGSSINKIGSKIERSIESSFASTAQTTANLLNLAIPNGHSLCRVRVQGEESFRLTTDSTSEPIFERCRRDVITL